MFLYLTFRHDLRAKHFYVVIFGGNSGSEAVVDWRFRGQERTRVRFTFPIFFNGVFELPPLTEKKRDSKKMEEKTWKIRSSSAS